MPADPAVVADLSELVRLEDPDFYSDDPFPLYARLRRESPVHYYEPLDLWLLTRYEDIREVGRTPLIFSSSDGILLNDFRYGNVVASFFPPNAENFALDGPPRHAELRKAIRTPFSPVNVAKLNEQVRSVVVEILDAIVPGEDTDWLTDVAMAVPSVMIATLLGMPPEDRPLLDGWANEIIKMGAAVGKEELAEVAAGLGGMYAYFADQLADRRRNPGTDLLTALAQAEDAGALNNETVHMMVAGVLSAGNETTRNLVAGLAVAFSEHPEQYARLVTDPTLARNATDELLRWITPVRGFGRTVTEDTEIGGQAMRRGQRVYMLYGAANRDETVFADPETFDIGRDFREAMHLSFGFGEHSCIGSSLARLETATVLEEMARRFRSIELAGTPRRHAQLLANAYESLHVTVRV
ncbi:cytochrome P450 [Nocardia jiangxiensis]|uniref:cytochrome P450 n=1 Tax=Nocardia jiangxiensis TaxID=282685 RepID=UPI0002ED132D|nr:cytochrome P450 [Nocardia jiangxiensis]